MAFSLLPSVPITYADDEILVGDAEALKSAIDDAVGGETITLGDNIVYDVGYWGNITINKSITINLAGHTLTYDSGKIVIEYAEVTSRDYVIFSNLGELTIKGGRFESTKMTALYINKTGTTLNIKPGYRTDPAVWTPAKIVTIVPLYNIVVTKVDKDALTQMLNDAVFDLYLGDSAEPLVKVTDYDYTNNEDGTYTFSGLVAGTYFVVEKTAPEGYVPDDTRRPVTFKDEDKDKDKDKDKNKDEDVGESIRELGRTG